MTAVKLSTRALPSLLAALISLHALGQAHASDNSYSSLEVIQLLVGTAGSRHISDTPPPPVPPPKPPPLQALQQQLAAQRQSLAQQQAGLTSAQSMLAFWEAQPSDVAEINVPQWTNAVASDQKIVARIEAQIAQLQAQIASAQ